MFVTDTWEKSGDTIKAVKPFTRYIRKEKMLHYK